jgi:hypothetical protein
MNVTGLAAFCASKKMSRLAMAIPRVYNDCEGPKSFIKAALGIDPDRIVQPSYIGTRPSVIP